ncbi:putative metalloprotease CJM1_0395 family protein [Roseibium aggregatum]|uniref:SprA family protein n=1 Tax=Roseibium aggregatum TaxID=187304 RepID=A0A939EFR3_9HYPH|nr:putative metalloprotease CJM1_0395 family protein [Roseibium aggregatum]MBN9672335.1 hypothetical protein [Roseibium aggregatum]
MAGLPSEEEAIRTGGVAVLTPEAVIALQKTETGNETGARSQPDDGADAGSQEGQSSGAVAQTQDDPEEEEDADGDGLNEAEEKQVEKLAQRDREVRAHEQAHARVGGAYASAPSYTFQQGPDGKRYAIGGEVQIDTAKERTPEATVRKMQIVIRAATAPAEPSSQDLKVAQQARSQLSEAQAELRQQKAEELNGDEEGEAGAPGSGEAAEAGADQQSENPAGAPADEKADAGASETQRGKDAEKAAAAYQSALQRIDDAQSLFNTLVS